MEKAKCMSVEEVPFCGWVTAGELSRCVAERFGIRADIDLERGIIDGGYVAVAGGKQRYKLAMFIRPGGGGWELSEKILLPVNENIGL